MKKIEIECFLKLFNRGGYVLDFSTDTFDAFTKSCVGIALCEHYKLSKGASLVTFCSEADISSVKKLLFDLFAHYEAFFLDKEREEEFAALYLKCKEIKMREESSTLLATPIVSTVDREYIVDLCARANRDVNNGEYDSALTKARSLLDEVFCHAIEAKTNVPTEKGDIEQRFNQFKDLYGMRQGKAFDKRVNMLLSGLEKIVSSLTQMRNGYSDAHGVGANRIRLEEHHARLFVNAAATMAEFVLAVENNARD